MPHGQPALDLVYNYVFELGAVGFALNVLRLSVLQFRCTEWGEYEIASTLQTWDLLGKRRLETVSSTLNSFDDAKRALAAFMSQSQSQLAKKSSSSLPTARKAHRGAARRRIHALTEKTLAAARARVAKIQATAWKRRKRDAKAARKDDTVPIDAPPPSSPRACAIGA